MTVTESPNLAPPPTDLPAMEVSARLGRLRDRLDSAGCDALVVTELTNIRYLTGFTGSAAMVLVTATDAVFVTDGRYRDRSADEMAAAGVVADIRIVTGAADEAIAEAALDAGVGRLGLEADHVSWSAQQRWADQLLPDGDLVATTGVVEALRLVKDDGEVARIRSACAIADRALAQIRGRLLDGPTEAEFAGWRALFGVLTVFGTLCLLFVWKPLGESLDPPLGKSGVNHRMRRLLASAEAAADQTDLAAPSGSSHP